MNICFHFCFSPVIPSSLSSNLTWRVLLFEIYFSSFPFSEYSCNNKLDSQLYSFFFTRNRMLPMDEEGIHWRGHLIVYPLFSFISSLSLFSHLRVLISSKEEFLLETLLPGLWIVSCNLPPPLLSFSFSVFLFVSSGHFSISRVLTLVFNLASNHIIHSREFREANAPIPSSIYSSNLSR